jgi:hypothetical protein
MRLSVGQRKKDDTETLTEKMPPVNPGPWSLGAWLLGD